MAADGGLVAKGEEIVAVSGTHRGADTAVVALASTSTALHELHVTEILCKPLLTKSWRRGALPPQYRRGRREDNVEDGGDQ